MISKNVAVIIPLYNGKLYLEEAVRSVCGQTLQPNEIVIVDDGSTDDSLAFAQQLASVYPIRVLHKENGGQGSSRNFGVAHTTSELIAFLDQDDAWYPHHLKTLIEALNDAEESPPVGWTYANFDIVSASGEMEVHSFLNKLTNTPQPKESLADCLASDMHILPSASLIKREAFESVGGFDPRLTGYEDDDLFLRLFVKGYRGVYVNEPVYRWRMHPDSTSNSFRMLRSRSIYCRKLIERYNDETSWISCSPKRLVASRFFKLMAEDFTRYTHKGRISEAKFILGECRYILNYFSRKKVWRSSVSLGLLDQDWMYRMLGRSSLARSLGRKAMRAAIRRAKR